jgi:hypothetical protein
MRILKIIIGLGCLVISLIPALLVLGELTFFFNWPFSICTLCLVGSGCFLIIKQNSPFSKATRLVTVTSISILVGFVLAVVIPSFVAATLVRSSNACVNNLRQIDAAKQEWALENGKTNGVVIESDIKPYIKLDSKGNIPKCPQGGAYTIGRLGEDPKCSIGTSDWPNTHALNYTGGSWWINVKAAYSILLGLHRAQSPRNDSARFENRPLIQSAAHPNRSHLFQQNVVFVM